MLSNYLQILKTQFSSNKSMDIRIDWDAFYFKYFNTNIQVSVSTTWVVTKINGHRDKRSSEMITLKMVNWFNNNIKQPNVMISIV